eukprot:TRINITY_DN4383_c0_g1_i1.p1 TRINITY_DN4383_c0_g1~~TRINITY_DN4383_c0_g1_i1.p1  ORF type:complete len:59 (-),score=1.23 TRINITY_DN4383_c0_g1_i1:74-250(-)
MVRGAMCVTLDISFKLRCFDGSSARLHIMKIAPPANVAGVFPSTYPLFDATDTACWQL